MQIKAKVGGNTTSGEFKALAIFFNALAANKESELIPAAEQPKQFIGEAGPKVVISDEPVQGQAQAAEQPQAQTQTTTRRRRTKAEIEADEAAKKPADPEPEPVADVKPEGADASNENQAAAAEVKAEVVDTTTGEIKDVEEFEKAAEAAALTGGKTYTEAEVQSLAAVVARSKGAQVVKDKIAELGKARIADLDESQVNQLGAFLESQK